MSTSAVLEADSSTTSLTPQTVEEAHWRIAPHIRKTPVLGSDILNDWLGHELFFKCEGFQKTGSFKLRGALNALLSLKENNALPGHIIAFSSGNHAQAVAYGAKMLGIKATIYMPHFVSRVKQNATRSYGAELVLTHTRMEAEERVKELARQGACFIPSFDYDAVIAGQGTACLEALEEGVKPDAIFATCGGGGLLSGIYLASQLAAPTTQIFAGEPKNANDAAQSYRTGAIVRFHDSPPSIADGARTLAVSARTFHFLKKLAGFYEIDEETIIYWSQWLTHMLKTPVEPTSAVAMGAACAWLKGQKSKRRVLILLSGGNIDAASYQAIWRKDYLENRPEL